MHFPLPNGLRFYYHLLNDRLIFAAELRLVRKTDPPVIIETLDAGVLSFRRPSLVPCLFLLIWTGGSLPDRESLVVIMPVANQNLTPDDVTSAVAKSALIPTPNQEVWK
jgi:hypothetical protein